MDTNKCYENQYNNNSNGLLVILLLIVLLKSDKTKQECEAISKKLQEEHILNEDIEKITNVSETDSNNFKNKRIKTNIEKAKIKMLIKDLQPSIEQIIHSDEVNEQSIETLGQKESKELDKEKSEELDKEKIEKVDEENVDKEKKDKEKSKKLEKESLEKLDKKVLEELDKKNLKEMKGLKKNFGGNSIMPMEVMLKQLVGENISFSTVARSNGFVTNATLLSVKDGIVHMDTSHSILSIPVCEIVGIESNLIHSIELQSLVETPTEESYKYKEWSLRNLFSTMIGEKIFIETTGSGSFDNINDKIITNVGQGIVVLDNTMAISLSKIILVERK